MKIKVRMQSAKTKGQLDVSATSVKEVLKRRKHQAISIVINFPSLS
jgi:hypothetical protein